MEDFAKEFETLTRMIENLQSIVDGRIMKRDEYIAHLERQIQKLQTEIMGLRRDNDELRLRLESTGTACGITTNDDSAEVNAVA